MWSYGLTLLRYNLHYEKFQDGSVKCIEDEIPFEIPQGWEWCRLSQIAFFSGGKTPSTSKKEYWGNEVLWVTSKDMKEKYIGSSLLKLSQLGATTMQIYPIGTLLIVTRSGILRHTLPVAILKKESTINQDIKAISLVLPELAEYIYSCLKGMEPRLLRLYSKSGVTVENIDFNKFQNTLFPLAPLDEIHRILSMSEIAVRYVNQIENSKSELAEIMSKTKSRILDLAIRGKLVPQDPNDEPASVLLERIRAEKEDLIKQGKIKRDEKESVIFKGEDNSYYETVPTNWGEVSLSDIAEIELGKTLDTEKNTGEMFPYLRSVNILWNNTDLSDIKEMKFEPDEFERFSVRKGDLLICEGGDVGRCSVWRKEETIFYQNALHRVHFYGNCDAQFFVYAILYLESIGYLKRISNGVTIKHLTKSILIRIPFLLPPLAEQHRIVAAIETYFSTLDKISSCLA